MRLGKALATGVAEERPRATDEETLLGERVDEAAKAAKAGKTEAAEGAARVVDEVPVAR
ncbi:hypothetical protein ACTMUQ_23570 [Streptomyces sp. SD11]|uniref:hypothetical protein n=1 Tax=unclassified Streptomyces TaxID=2593676 RepID=UPI00200C4979|nr:hypothetical protein [Streptomyces sp. LRE541]UPZ31966.1 hypothetical protein MUK60_31745 [Streptomyces sp. LRE541]